MASSSTPGQSMDAPHKNTIPSAPHDKLRIERLQHLLATISQQLGSFSAQDSPSSEELLHGTGVEPTTSETSPSSHSTSNSTVLHTTPPPPTTTTPPTTTPTVLDLLKTALNKISTLFTTAPPASPRAESQLSYSLTVNAKYRAHMDDAPLRAGELERDLQGVKERLEEVLGVVGECRGIVDELVEEMADQVIGVGQDWVGDGGSGQAAGGNFMAAGLRVAGQSRAEDGVTIEERMGRAGVKSWAFV